MGRRLATCAFVAGVQMAAWSCSSRVSSVGVPVAPAPATAEEPTPAPVVPPVQAAAPASAAALAESTSEACALTAEPGEPVGTVALGERVDPANAPHPSNDSERLLFRRLYETLVRMDCNGVVRPGLAASWQLDPGGRAWIVTLRDEARFSDGTPVTSADVRASWTGRDGIQLRPQASRLIESIDVTGDRTLAITLRRPREDAPLALAHPDLAIAKSTSASPWPLGTRAARIATDSRPAGGGAAGVITVVRDARPAIRFRVAAGDPRDLLDEGVDLLLTRDPAALAYAATLPQFQSVPLPWQRVHVLLVPGRARSSPTLSESQRQVLADDAVRGEAQGARGPFWWQTAQGCEVAAPSPLRQAAAPSRIVYDAGDAASRDLAERLVGLARVPGAASAAFLDVLLPDRPKRSFQRAAGLTGDDLARARRLGADAGYVVPLDARPVDACRALSILTESVPWLDAEAIVPLVETRLQAVIRRGRSGVSAEWDGGVMLDGADASR